MADKYPNPTPYTVIGGGFAGLCAVVSLINAGVDIKDIQWIDPEFKAGAFGKEFSVGSSRKVIRENLNIIWEKIALMLTYY